MDIQNSKIEIAKLILNLENPSLLEKIKDLILNHQSDFGDNLSLAQQEEIQLAIDQLNAGKRTSFDDYMKKVS